MINIRIGTIEDLRLLWKNTLNRDYYISNIEKGIIEPWFIEDNKRIIGELYIFWDSIDKDEADGINRAYLAAFRVESEYRGQGLGNLLMNSTFTRIKEKQYKQITIGVESNNQRLVEMYYHYGFKELVKYQNYDNHYIDEEGNPHKEDIPTALLLKLLE